MQISSIIGKRSKILDSRRDPGSVVLSSRIRLARNLNKYAFPARASLTQRTEVNQACQQAIASLPEMEDGIILNMENLGDLEKQVLTERHLISRELLNSSSGSSVIVNQGQTCGIMINEEDHLRIQFLQTGFEFKKIWKQIDTVDNQLSEYLQFAFSDKLGYLTACPTNLGTGMRASAMMHLPGLVMAAQMDKVIRAVNQLGIAVRGLFGEGTDASGSIFQISNQQTLGESEATILKRLERVFKTIIEQELNARKKLLASEPDKVFDKIGRAFGTLRYAKLISSAESINLLSLMRLAIDYGLFPSSHRRSIDRLLVTSQPGHIQISNKEPVDSEERDRQRARHLTKYFKALPDLDFDKLNKK